MEQLLRKSQKDFNKIFKITRGQHPILLKTYLAKRITLETVCVLENMLKYIKDFDNYQIDITNNNEWRDLASIIRKKYTKIDVLVKSIIYYCNLIQSHCQSPNWHK